MYICINWFGQVVSGVCLRDLGIGRQPDNCQSNHSLCPVNLQSAFVKFSFRKLMALAMLYLRKNIQC